MNLCEYCYISQISFEVNNFDKVLQGTIYGVHLYKENVRLEANVR